MEFNSTFYMQKKHQFNTLLTKQTIDMIDKYSVFYGIPANQVIEESLTQAFGKDLAFLDYYGKLCRGEISKRPPITVDDQCR